MISKSVTSHPGKQAITIHILPNFSESKGNQKIQFDQLIKYNKKNIFLQNSCRKRRGRLIPILFLFFKKASHEVKAVFKETSKLSADIT